MGKFIWEIEEFFWEIKFEFSRKKSGVQKVQKLGGLVQAGEKFATMLTLINSPVACVSCRSSLSIT